MDHSGWGWKLIIVKVIICEGRGCMGGFPGSSAGKESTCNSGDPWVLSLGRSPGGGHGNPLQYSCMENPYRQEPGGLQPMELQRVGYD